MEQKYFGTFKNFISLENLLEVMSTEINTIKTTKMKDGSFMPNDIEATKITSDWFMDASYCK